MLVMNDNLNALLEKHPIVTVKYRCNRTIFVAIPSNNSNITFLHYRCNMWHSNRLMQQNFGLDVIHKVNCNTIKHCDL
jgi:hypothetical protein